MPYAEQQVTSVRWWSDKTFTFTTTRPDGFDFQNGEFVTLGLRPEGKLISRAYSIVSTNRDENLEFLSIHVPDGPLTSRLAKIREGDSVWVNTKSTGSLTLGHVRPGRNLYLLATGTGLAPFISLVRSQELYEAHEKVVLVHTVRSQNDLAYREELQARDGDGLRYVPTVTREPFPTTERGADMFRSGELFTQLGLPAADPEQDRVMICGNPNMNREMSDYLKENGWKKTNYQGVGEFTVEQAFVLHHS